MLAFILMHVTVVLVLQAGKAVMQIAPVLGRVGCVKISIDDLMEIGMEKSIAS